MKSINPVSQALFLIAAGLFTPVIWAIGEWIVDWLMKTCCQN